MNEKTYRCPRCIHQSTYGDYHHRLKSLYYYERIKSKLHCRKVGRYYCTICDAVYLEEELEKKKGEK